MCGTARYVKRLVLHTYTYRELTLQRTYPQPTFPRAGLTRAEPLGKHVHHTITPGHSASGY